MKPLLTDASKLRTPSNSGSFLRNQLHAFYKLNPPNGGQNVSKLSCPLFRGFTILIIFIMVKNNRWLKISHSITDIIINVSTIWLILKTIFWRILWYLYKVSNEKTISNFYCQTIKKKYFNYHRLSRFFQSLQILWTMIPKPQLHCVCLTWVVANYYIEMYTTCLYVQIFFLIMMTNVNIRFNQTPI